MGMQIETGLVCYLIPFGMAGLRTAAYADENTIEMEHLETTGGDGNSYYGNHYEGLFRNSKLGYYSAVRLRSLYLKELMSASHRNSCTFVFIVS